MPWSNSTTLKQTSFVTEQTSCLLLASLKYSSTCGQPGHIRRGGIRQEMRANQ